MNMKEKLLEKYMEKNPSAADIISFLSIVAEQPQNILYIYNSLPQSIREKLADQSFLDVVSWLRDYDKADKERKKQLVDIIPQKKDIGIEILDRDLKNMNLTVRIKDNVFIIRTGMIDYIYGTLGERKMKINDVEAVYLSSYDDWLKSR